MAPPVAGFALSGEEGDRILYAAGMTRKTARGRAVLILALIFSTAAGDQSRAADLPDMTCSEDKEVSLAPSTLAARESVSGDTYIFADGDLNLATSHHGVYTYGGVRESDDHRYLVGAKTLIFNADFSELMMIHADSIAIRIARFTCERG